jgi:hypothetical protein
LIVVVPCRSKHAHTPNNALHLLLAVGFNQPKHHRHLSANTAPASFRQPSQPTFPTMSKNRL